ncbi:MAG: hypothetical protein WCF08_02945 [Anaerolineaceae bacterium]
MNISLTQSKIALDNLGSPTKSTRRAVCTLILLAALAAFEAFNYSTTVYALQSLLGGYTILGMRWAATLAVAFCCIDIAGITQLFNPIGRSAKTIKDHYLFGTWLLAAGMNALLTWRGIAMAITIQQAQTGWVVDSDILIKTIPAFMAFMTWLIRILIIGAFSQSDKSVSGQEQIRSSSVTSGSFQQAGEYGLFESDFPHAQVQFNRSSLIPRSKPIKREPTYRGLPLRYKTF